MKKILYIVLLLYIVVACERDKSINKANQPVIGEIKVDTFQVQIKIDKTEGFKYPRLYHEIYFIGHLTVPGVIGDFYYESFDVGYIVTSDFSGPSPKGTPFHHKAIKWSSELLEPGTEVPFSFVAASSLTQSKVPAFKVDSISVVEEGYFGQRPEIGSVQLTSSHFTCYHPIYTKTRSGFTTYHMIEIVISTV